MYDGADIVDGDYIHLRSFDRFLRNVFNSLNGLETNKFFVSFMKTRQKD